MKFKSGLLGAAIALLISGCGEPTAYGKVDKSPYATKECINELSRGAELKGSSIDKIVAYKKKRKMYAGGTLTLLD